MNRVVDYKLVQNQDRVAVEAEVGHLIKDGWQPLGPADVDEASSDWPITQTMVKYEDQPQTNET